MGKKIYEKNDEERKEIEKELKDILAKGNKTVYQIVTKVSNSGMYRHITNFVATGKGKIISIDWEICRIMQTFKYEEDGVGVSGCGMDMGFHIVYELSYKLYGDGYKLTQKWLR